MVRTGAIGFHEVIPERLDLTVGYGRGERLRPDTNDLIGTVRVAVQGDPDPLDVVA
jgi:hypothetical protein